jgi:Spy/CpxP family protein refolding chaperone
MSGIPFDGSDGDAAPQPAARHGPSRRRVLALLTLALLLVAAAGVASGVVLERRVLSHHGDRDHERGLGGRRGEQGRGPMHERFGRDLDLSKEQQLKIDSIFASHRATIDSARASSEPKIRAIIEQTRREIDSVLTPAQREKMHARMQREHPRGDSTEPPRGPPRF